MDRGHRHGGGQATPVRWWTFWKRQSKPPRRGETGDSRRRRYARESLRRNQVEQQHHHKHHYVHQHHHHFPSPLPPLPAGWEMIHSRSHGQIYYWNASLGKSQWEHPQAQPEPMCPMCPLPTPICPPLPPVLSWPLASHPLPSPTTPVSSPHWRNAAI